MVRAETAADLLEELMLADGGGDPSLGRRRAMALMLHAFAAAARADATSVDNTRGALDSCTAAEELTKGEPSHPMAVACAAKWATVAGLRGEGDADLLETAMARLAETKEILKDRELVASAEAQGFCVHMMYCTDDEVQQAVDAASESAQSANKRKLGAEL